MKRTLAKYGAIWGVWTLLAVLLAGESALYEINIGETARFWHSLRIGLQDYWLWAALTPIIFYLAKRFRFTRENWGRATAIHFGFYLLLTLAHELAAQLIGVPTGAPDNYHGSLFRFRFVSSLYNDLWMYWPTVVIWSLFEYYQRYRERDMRAAQLKVQLARAELQALRSQLHPHFLFNTLNSIASLMHEDVNAADDMLGDLSVLLRVYLNCDGEQEVPLRREIALVETYVRIQKRRFEDRLSWLRDVPPELMDAAVPALLLQPLVENSILHGIAPRVGPGHVTLTARRNGSTLNLEIVDNGLGLARDHREKIGLSNTRSRLQQLYENQCVFEIASGENGGVAVRISLPLRVMPVDPDGHPDDDTNFSGRRRGAGAAADSVSAEAR